MVALLGLLSCCGPEQIPLAAAAPDVYTPILHYGLANNCSYPYHLADHHLHGRKGGKHRLR